MRTLTILGIILIILGVAALIYGGFAYTDREQVAEVGPLELEVERERRVPVPPILGAVLIAGGAIMLVIGWRRAERGG